jgi:hypothetical protein
MTITALKSAQPGEFAFTPTQEDYLLRFTPYKPGEAVRPGAKPNGKRGGP